MSASDNIEDLLEDFNRELALERSCPTRLSNDCYRKYIWDLSKEFNMSDDGTPYLVCKLLEMFLGRVMQNYTRTNPGSYDALGYSSFLYRNMFRYIMCCFTIITKNNSKKVTMDLYFQTTLMNALGLSCELRVKTELLILDILNFQIPTMSSFDILYYMLDYIQCPLSWFSFIAAILDSAELHRYYVLKEMNESAALVHLPDEVYYLTNLHLAVATIVASTQTYFFMEGERDCIFFLADKISVHVIYLDVLAKSIMTFFLSPKIQL